MDSKKILICSVSYFPKISPRSFRATELSKELARQGHSVTVLTNKRDYNYESFEKEHNIRVEDFVFSKWHEMKNQNLIIKVVRVLLQSLFIYPDIRLTVLLKKALKTHSHYDLLISIAVPYPVHWGVALAQKNNPNLCSTWVADCGDPFLGNKEQRIKYPFYFRFVENWFCKKPNYITIPIIEAKKAYPSICQDKIRIIPQGFKFEKQENIESISQCEKTINFAYAGALSSSFRNPSEFLEYLCSKKEINFKFIIYTNSKSLIDPFIKRLGNKIDVRDYIPREELINELKKMDFVVNIENKNSVQSPSKLIDYAICGKPILSIKPFHLNKKIVNEFLARNYSNKYIIENIEQYNIENVVTQFLSLIKK